MKKISLVLFVVTIIIVTNMCITVFAEEEPTDEETYVTGAILMTDEEIQAFKECTPQIIDVKPNRLYYERVQEEYSDLFEDGMSMSFVADGEEIVTSLGEASVALLEDETVILPSKVDNSLEYTFPTIGNQGNLGSCVGWSLGYYQLTNNANKIRGTAARDKNENIEASVYSPNWVYNLGNSGRNDGMKVNEALNILYTYGCPTIEDVPIQKRYSLATNYLSWYPIASIWENALYNKCELYYGTVNPDKLDTPIASPDSVYLNDIKALLADGYVVTVETCVEPEGDTYLPIVRTGRTSNNNSAYVWTEVREVNNGGHTVTIVGYDDNFRIDINRDGVYQTGEYGAFKIANSWGDNIEKHNDGYVWISYDALNAVSSVQSFVNEDRMPAFGNSGLYYFVRPLKKYMPLLTAEVEIMTQHRGDIIVYVGICDNDSSENYYEKRITSTDFTMEDEDGIYKINEGVAFGYATGDYNLSGTNENASGTVTFDLTSLLKDFEMEYGRGYNICLKLKDYSKTSEIISFTLKDHNTGIEYSADEITISITENNTLGNATVSYLSSITSVKADKTFTLKFNSKIDESTVDDAVVAIVNEDDYIAIDIGTGEDDEQICLSKQSGLFSNGFYQINISPELRSKGGNSLKNAVNWSFYVPFH